MPDELRKSPNFVCFEKLYIEDDEPEIAGETVADATGPLIGWLEQSGALPSRSWNSGCKKNPESPSGA